MSWKDGEQSFSHIVSKVDTFVCQLVHGCLDLNRWRGQVAIDISSDSQHIELIWMDVFEEQLSYQCIEHLGKRGHFRRLAYGRVDLIEFKELVYAAVTDMLVSNGKKGYAELAMASFPHNLYQRLAKQLGRPGDLPEDGDMDTEDSRELTEEPDWTWESEEGEDAEDDVLKLPHQQGELIVRPEFLELAKLISDKGEHKTGSK